MTHPRTARFEATDPPPRRNDGPVVLTTIQANGVTLGVEHFGDASEAG